MGEFRGETKSNNGGHDHDDLSLRLVALQAPKNHGVKKPCRGSKIIAKMSMVTGVDGCLKKSQPRFTLAPTTCFHRMSCCHGSDKSAPPTLTLILPNATGQISWKQFTTHRTRTKNAKQGPDFVHLPRFGVGGSEVNMKAVRACFMRVFMTFRSQPLQHSNVSQ